MCVCTWGEGWGVSQPKELYSKNYTTFAHLDAVLLSSSPPLSLGLVVSCLPSTPCVGAACGSEYKIVLLLSLTDRLLPCEVLSKLLIATEALELGGSEPCRRRAFGRGFPEASVCEGDVCVVSNHIYPTLLVIS